MASSGPEKITQLQCHSTNLDLRAFFFDAASGSFKHCPHLLSAIYLELELLLDFLQYRFTISLGKPQPGDYLQNIQFRPLSNTRRLLWLLLSCVVPYILKKFKQLVINSTDKWVQQALRIVYFLQRIHSAAEFINLAVFIVKGQYRTLICRLLSIRMEFINKNSSRVLNFSLMNRRLIWQVYELFLKEALPYIYDLVGPSMKSVFYLSSYLGIQDASYSCVFCAASQPTMPLKLECGHLSCYYCAKKQRSTNDQMACGKCKKKIQH